MCPPGVLVSQVLYGFPLHQIEDEYALEIVEHNYFMEHLIKASKIFQSIGLITFFILRIRV